LNKNLDFLQGAEGGKRLGRFVGVRRCSPRAYFLVLMFAAYRQHVLFFAGVAVRVAVQIDEFILILESVSYRPNKVSKKRLGR